MTGPLKEDISMKLEEILVTDYAEHAYLNMHNILESLKLLENNNNTIIFNDFIESEKLLCIRNLDTTNLYFPLYLQSAPVGEIIIGKYTKEPSNFIRINESKFEFKNSKGIFKFPLDLNQGDGRIDLNQGDGRIDLLIFDTINNQQHFLSTLTLKFGNWRINISQI
jgi:hypothetical protein